MKTYDIYYKGFTGILYFGKKEAESAEAIIEQMLRNAWKRDDIIIIERGE